MDALDDPTKPPAEPPDVATTSPPADEPVIEPPKAFPTRPPTARSPVTSTLACTFWTLPEFSAPMTEPAFLLAVMLPPARVRSRTPLPPASVAIEIRPTYSLVGALMVRPERVWFCPSRLPVKLEPNPMDWNPLAPQMLEEVSALLVADKSMSAPST